MKVGDYVRTKKGSIAKVLGIDYYIEGNGEELSNIDSIYFDNVIDDIDKDIHSGVFQDCLKEYKSSPNIIDLIEVGDYVNGSRIEEIEEYNGEKYLYLEEMEYSNANQDYINVYCKQEYIESIVTKEQFSQMEYRIGE